MIALEARATDARETSGSDRIGGFVMLCAAIGALGGLLFGYDTGIISAALLSITRSYALSTGGQELVVAALNLGAVAGAALSGPISDRIGRRRTIMIGAVLFALGAAGSGMTPSLSGLLAARLLLGVSVGAATQIIPVYVAELAPSRHRGVLVVLFQLAVVGGILLAFLVGYGVSGLHAAWRIMFLIGVIPAVLLGVGMIALPESPRWLYLRGRGDEALAALERVRPDRASARHEMARIRAAALQQEGGWSELKSPWCRPALIAGLGIAALSQLTGPNVVIYYAPIILSQAGLGHGGALLATVGVGVASALGTAAGMAMVDRTGRRRLLLLMLPAAAACLVASGLCLLGGDPSGWRLWLMLAGLMGYIVFNCGSLSVTVWLIASEVFPMAVRGTGMGLASVTVWLCDLLVSLTTLHIVEGIGTAGTFCLFGAVNLLAWGFVRRFVPETGNCSLEEIEQALRNGSFAQGRGMAVAESDAG
ncbi:sugar porter family MFS transporter [Acetobacteraceae bacterium KSS8]|uniref:Sugar porter family MFS transporter n=1 Tax=Endosaccharibacter trunci TaxID=2812733 RepID=A0ABT1W2Q3_9PROT|nr:sugar porter family MFS transporter [Acetobacteraceae bacterium KSS8]